MSEFASVPVPTPDSDEFWAGCHEGELRMPRCSACGQLNWFPRAICRNCSSDELRWEPLAGRGRVYTFSVVHRPPTPSMPDRYVLALVELDEGPRMMTHIVDVDPDAVRVGMAVEVDFRPVSDDIDLPVFRAAQ